MRRGVATDAAASVRARARTSRIEIRRGKQGPAPPLCDQRRPGATAFLNPARAAALAFLAYPLGHPPGAIGDTPPCLTPSPRRSGRRHCAARNTSSITQRSSLLFGPVASETTSHRVLKSIDQELLDGLRRGRAQAHARAWRAGARPERLVLDHRRDASATPVARQRASHGDLPVTHADRVQDGSPGRD